MPSIYERIAQEAAALPEGTLFGPKRFKECGLPSSVRRVLDRLCREGKLEKVHAGVYAVPLQPRWGVKDLHVSAPEILDYLKASGKLEYGMHGAMAVNLLGLSTQVQCGFAYSTTGRSRRLHLGGNDIRLEHVPAWQHLFGETPEGIALIAIGYLGRRECTKKAFAQIAEKLPPESLTRLRKETAGHVPGWVRKIIGAEEE